MQRKFIFSDIYGAAMALPVTPPEFMIEHGVSIETVNITSAGDVNITGGGTLATLKIDCLFPAQQYPFSGTLVYGSPYEYVGYFERAAYAKDPLRLIITDTSINMQFLVESISAGERDGTGDVYASISLREYRELTVMNDNGEASTGAREYPRESPQGVSSYTVKKGDTLSAIALKFYGSASFKTYTKLADANDILNPNIIWEGQILKIPATLL